MTVTESDPRQRTAGDVVDEALRHLLAHDMTAFASLWAEDGRITYPFAGPGYPTQVVGREAVHEHLRSYPERLDVRAITHRAVHQSTDPDVAVVEFEVDGAVVATGRSYHIGYVAVVHCRDGAITEYRDHWDYLAAARIMGGTDQLDAAFAVEGA